MVDFSIEPFKEPRGFLKVLQWLFAICAFATTVNFSTTLSFSLTCTHPGPVNASTTPQPNTTITIQQAVEYPFCVDSQTQNIKLCNGTEDTWQFHGHAKSDSEFFVTTGVLCFLYSTALIGVYLTADKLYTESPRMPMADFVVTVVFTLFWLAGSSAWANGLTNLKTGADLGEWVHLTELCESDHTTCADYNTGSFGGIVISILFGYINFILWSANLWFLYKETSWFDGFKSNTNANVGNTGA